MMCIELLGIASCGSLNHSTTRSHQAAGIPEQHDIYKIYQYPPTAHGSGESMRTHVFFRKEFNGFHGLSIHATAMPFTAATIRLGVDQSARPSKAPFAAKPRRRCTGTPAEMMGEH